MRCSSMTRRGLALIVVVGILGVLAILSVTFVTMTRLERKASQQRLHATKAFFLARSGIEDALARLGAGQDPGVAGSSYGGEDWDNSNTLNGFEGAAELYQAGTLNRDDCPVRHAMKPSYYVRSPSGGPALLPVGGRLRGYSGLLKGDQTALGNQHVLKMSPQAGIHLNGGDPTAASYLGYNSVLRRILRNLAEALDRENPGLYYGCPVDQTDGRNLIDLRPPGGLTSWEQVRDLALGGSQAKLDAFKPYLAFCPWVSPTTL